MPDLIAQGPSAADRWRRPLPVPGDVAVFILGRTSHPWSVPWDDRISRQHAELKWTGERLLVTRLLESRNPVFHRGLRKDSFELGVGDHFVIGQTTFSLVDQRIRVVAKSELPLR